MTMFEANAGLGPAGVGAGPVTAQAALANKVSWGAIFAGVTIALVVQVILTLVGTGIGIATLDPAAGAADNPSASSFSIAAAVWALASALVAAFVGGYIAARLSGRIDRTASALHGLTTWAFTTLLVLYLLTTTIGSLVGGAVGGVTSALGSVGQSAVQAAAPAVANSNVNPLDAIENEVQATGTDPEALQANAVNAIRALVTGSPDGADQARNEAAEALAQARGIPVEQARQDVTRIETETLAAIQSAQETATQAAETTASVVSKGSLLAALALVLGALAGWLGGRAGVAPASTYAYGRT
ncbi:PhnA-like protein [Antarcticirhabdus aurantiaca]|uniref:PhnA-like protein n=1 Tax=Antarcticirhabdus aurantiaca TaxID=2606717 RepID=A0ACD4NSB8_9HYPH|nr:PhnA-like protein [Antarcticirhabdus aurantiaca]WAJ29623.1 PhnA-like protein [Jeongeuplla avenae]